MKKFVIATACVVSLGLIAIGVQQFSASADDADSTQTLSLEEAKEQAQDQYPGTVTEIERKKENGTDVYEMEIVGNEYKYELKLDASSGEVIKLDEKEKINVKQKNSSQEQKEAESPGPTDNSSNGFAISIEEAKQIALDEVGGSVIEIEREEDDGMTYYEIELNTDKGEAEVEVDDQTGEIIVISYDD